MHFDNMRAVYTKAKYLHRNKVPLFKRLKDAAVSAIDINRNNKKTEIVIYTAKPGVVIGHGGEEIEKIKNEINKLTNENIVVSIFEVKNPDLDATLIAKQMAEQLEARASFRTVQKKAIQRVMKAGAMGIKTSISGRLAGADIARAEGYKEGVVSLHTLRMDVDYALAEASTTYGKLGCKVWICRGVAKNFKKVEKTEEKKGE